ncbi:hypothetical protein AB0H58_31200 [Nocardia neocaledoniensis]|uniref:hypothetical protein n=1 Tax=Nocardia neocaledoniensis TaxID=236511 RepID=UPI0033F89EEC
MNPWIAFFGSLIVATVALIGIAVSNRTNRAAIAATQRNVEATNSAAAVREHEKWQREQILAIATKALTTAHECHGVLERDPSKITEEQRIERLHTLGSHQVALLGYAQGLLMLGANDLARECEAIRTNLIVARGAYGESQIIVTAPVTEDTTPQELQDRLAGFGESVTRLGESQKAMMAAELALVGRAQKLLAPQVALPSSSTPQSPE